MKLTRLGVSFWLLLAAAPALAQDDEGSWELQDDEETEAEPGEWGPEPQAAGAQWPEEEAAGGQPAGGGAGYDAAPEAGEEPDDASGPAHRGARDWSFGPYLRLGWVPIDFFIGFLFDEAPTVFVPGFGATATYRQDDGPSFQIGLGYLSYSTEGAFRSSGDPDTDTEWVESDLALLHVTGSMLWSSEFSELLALEYGFGLDLGIVLGDLVRTEAFPDPNNAGEYLPCPVPPPGNAPITYCALGNAAYDEEGEHYNVVEERVPPIVPLPLLPHLALRITPADDFTVKAEAAFGIVQFWLGVSAAYAPEL